jgi:hypothetical protein
VPGSFGSSLTIFLYASTAAAAAACPSPTTCCSLLFAALVIAESIGSTNTD